MLKLGFDRKKCDFETWDGVMWEEDNFKVFRFFKRFVLVGIVVFYLGGNIFRLFGDFVKTLLEVGVV